MKHSVRMAALLAVAAFATQGAVPASDVAPGNKAPVFELPALQGEAVSLEAHAGKYVVLEWTNYDCPFVKKHYETGRFPALQKQMKEHDVVWLSICSSAPGKQGHFSKEQWEARMKAVDAAPAAVLLDTDGTVGRRYNVKNTPHMVLISPDGVILYMGAIDDQRGLDRSIMDAAVNYVAQALEEVKAGKPVSIPAVPAYGCTVKY